MTSKGYILYSYTENAHVHRNRNVNQGMGQKSLPGVSLKHKTTVATRHWDALGSVELKLLQTRCGIRDMVSVHSQSPVGGPPIPERNQGGGGGEVLLFRLQPGAIAYKKLWANRCLRVMTEACN